ncbi:cache domain-containing protein [Pseudomonas sp. Bout1]|uniref:sensor histidine kinase n=1 Tax=Pseudomonas sp. Bout1 TaxID=3048600 RepID=UPI002AB56165|nr:cache domain-containing protein [Pseudomonas sp. Bout1]MDY7533266.1 cache domain-containing protein [Pseudomonas sp. Bout1]MEB0183831.1 cache domain-containing protein [Pseudomonas sp. Bout1]
MSKVLNNNPPPKGWIRYRLLAIALVPMLVILPILLAINIYRWNSRFDGLAISKVNDDLTIAHLYVDKMLNGTEERISAVSKSARFRDLTSGRNVPATKIDEFLDETARVRGLDFLYLIDDVGRIIASSRVLATESPRWDWPIVKAALNGHPAARFDVFNQQELSSLSPQLADQAKIDLIALQEDENTPARLETRGLILHSASTATLGDGRRGALIAGVLLNNNSSFVDAINQLIYNEGSLPSDSNGTATVFLSDIRISTNVSLYEGKRAIGTRVSKEVGEAVLKYGKTWREQAFVVNDWYISAYEPLLDSYDRRVGMLYVGFLQKPFTNAKRETLIAIVIAFGVAVAATVPLFLVWTGNIFRPLERMTRTICEVESGDLSARTGLPHMTDEIGQVASELDHLLNQVQERDVELRLWNTELNQRVEERARELQQANEQLETTSKKLIMSEKLAAIGEITAGIAHEINNPIAVIQGNIEVIQSIIGSDADNAKNEFRLIDQQLMRISEMVTKLLRFSKPQEYAGVFERYIVADVIDDTLPLVHHLLKNTMISIERDDRATRLIVMSRTELQQVLVNLIVNACHALPQGGKLVLRSFDSDMDQTPGVLVEVSDNGDGMAPEVAIRIFDPFFTTKRREGTGLGLSISQMLVTRNGGTISVTSKPGEGTTFTVWLPEAI